MSDSANQPPGPRETSQALLRLLVVAWVVVDLLLFVVVPTLQQNLHTAGSAKVVLWGILFGQFGVLAGWLALGDSPWTSRPAITVMVFLFIHVAVRYFGGDAPSHDMWLGISSCYAGLVALPLLVLRLIGWSCQLAGVETTPRRWQFSILQILGLTTIVAATLGILQHLQSGLPETGYLPMALIVLSLATIAWVAWSSLLRLPLPLAWMIVLGIAPIMAWLGGTIGQFEFWEWTTFAVLQAIVLAANLTVLRIAGYELRRK